jgi:hypothetical protein
MKRKYRNNSTDTSPSNSSESSTTIVSLASKCIFRWSLLLFYLTFLFLSHHLASVIFFTIYILKRKKECQAKKPLWHVSIFPFIASLNLTVVKSIQLLLFKWEKDIQMVEWKRCRQSCRILCLSWQTSCELRTKTEIASGDLQWVCVLSGKRMMDVEKKSTHAYTYHSIACLPINFRADKTVQNTPPHRWNGSAIPPTGWSSHPDY